MIIIFYSYLLLILTVQDDYPQEMHQDSSEPNIPSLDCPSQVLNSKRNSGVQAPFLNPAVMLRIDFLDLTSINPRQCFLKLADEVDDPIPKITSNSQPDHISLNQQIFQEDRNRNRPNLINLNNKLLHRMQVEDDPNNSQQMFK